MTVEELITKLRFSLDDEVEPYLVSDDQMLNWLNEAYMRIQLHTSQWKFLHQRGIILTTEAGVEEYELPLIREIDVDSMYAVRDGETVKFPVCEEQYDSWAAGERFNGDTDGVIRSLVRMPGSIWLVDPAPTEVWNIYGNYWVEPQPLTSLSDEPIWDENYHDMLRFEVLTIAATVWPEEHEQGRIVADAQRNLPVLRNAFNRKYLEPVRGARAHF